jgi:hypothetical protein
MPSHTVLLVLAARTVNCPYTHERRPACLWNGYVRLFLIYERTHNCEKHDSWDLGIGGLG